MQLQQEIMNSLGKLQEDEVFLTDSIKKVNYTYADILLQAFIIGRKIKSRDINTIIACKNNGTDLVILYFAAMLHDITIIPIDPLKSKQEIYLICESHPEACIFSDIPLDGKEQNNLPVSEGSTGISFQTVINQFKNLDYNKTFLITYTSGSTGRPKGVKHSVYNLFFSAINFGRRLSFNSSNIVCHTMPMTYMAGILNTILLPFIMHSKIVLMPRFNVQTAIHFWNTVKEYNVNTFWLSPTMLHMLNIIDKKGSMKDYFASEKTLFCIGTAPLRRELKENFEQKYNVELFQSYGLSETLFVSTVAHDTESIENTAGELLDDVEINFTQDKEILIKVPWMFLGYTNEHTDSYFENGSYKTGDLGQVIENQLVITGRKKELIIRGGININPAEIEKIIFKREEIRECAVGSLLFQNEEIIACWYCSDRNDKEFVKSLHNDVIENLGNSYKVDRFIPLKELPKNLNGKIDMTKLKETEFQDDTKI